LPLENTQKSFLKKNYNELLIFFILFVIASSLVLYQNSLTNGDQRLLLGGDEPNYLLTTSTILKYGSLHIENYWLDPECDNIFKGSEKGCLSKVESSNESEFGEYCRSGIIGKDGHCYNKWQMGISLLLLPGYAAGKILGSMLEMTMVFSIMGVVIYKFCSKLTSTRTAFITTLLISFGTLLLSYSGEIFTEIPAALILISIMYLFFFKPHNFQFSSIIGILLGSLIFFKVNYLLFVVVLLPIFCYIIFKNKTQRKNIFCLLGFFVLFALLFLGYNFVTGPEGGMGEDRYTRDVILGEGRGFSFQTFGLENTPTGMLNHLLSNGNGIFIFTPLILLSIFGFRFFWWKDKKIAISTILVFAVFLLVHSAITPYAGCCSLPHKYIIPTMVLFAAPLAFLIERFSRNAIFLSILISTTFVGIYFNKIFSTIVTQHIPTRLRPELLSGIYDGLVGFLPYVQKNPEKLIRMPDPIFWFGVVVVICLFVFFVFYYFDRYKNLTSRKNR